MPVTFRRPSRRIVLAAALALVVAWAAAVLWSALDARGQLEAARAAVAEAQASLADGDLAATRSAVAAARDAVDRARARTGNPAFAAAEVVPLAGRTPRVVAAVTDAAAASVAVLESVVGQAGSLVTDDGRLALPLARTGDGRLDLAAVREVAAALDAVPLDDLRVAADALAAAPSTWVPEVARAARRDARELVDDAAGALERARAAVQVLPGFLGADGPRHYFLAMQNPAELRGTGGLIGFFAVLSVDDGAFAMSQPTVYNALNRDESGNRDLTPVPTSEDFRRRYEHVAAAGFFANVNVDPDLPTTAPVILDLFAARRGQELDGLIAIDPLALADIMGAIGPVPLPEEVVAAADGRIANPVAAADIPLVTMVDAYDVFGGPSAERKEFLGVFAEAVFRQLFTTSWDAIDVGRRVGESVADTHLQVHSRDPREQAAFELLGVAGAMPRVPEEAGDGPADLLGVSANNAAGNKQDVHVAHRLDVEVALGAVAGTEATRDATVAVELENPLPTSGRDLYIIGAHPPDANRKGPEALWSSPRGLNRTWFTVWGPASSALAAIRDDDGDALPRLTGTIHGHRAVDHFLETPSKSSNGFVVDLQGPVSLRRDGTDLVYELALWHQAKAVPDHWDVTVTAPDGWQVAEVTLAGGGSGAGMGAGGEAVPLRATVSDDRAAARLTGSAMAQVRLEVRLERGTWDRFRDWLGRPAFRP